jgi:hypothetical protein
MLYPHASEPALFSLGSPYVAVNHASNASSVIGGRSSAGGVGWQCGAVGSGTNAEVMPTTR